MWTADLEGRPVTAAARGAGSRVALRPPAVLCWRRRSWAGVITWESGSQGSALPSLLRSGGSRAAPRRPQRASDRPPGLLLAGCAPVPRTSAVRGPLLAPLHVPLAWGTACGGARGRAPVSVRACEGTRAPVYACVLACVCVRMTGGCKAGIRVFVHACVRVRGRTRMSLDVHVSVHMCAPVCPSVCAHVCINRNRKGAPE